MSANPMPIELDPLSCEVCLKEIPVSEAKSEEATDYVVYLCGLDCYQQWLRQSGTQSD
jgi:hypothetical protein